MKILISILFFNMYKFKYKYSKSKYRIGKNLIIFFKINFEYESTIIFLNK